MKALKIIAGILLFMVAAFFSVGMMCPRYTYENHVVIDRPVEAVWAVFADHSRTSEWLEGLQTIECVEGVPLTIGCRWRLVFLDNDEEIEIIETVTACQPPEFYAFDMETDPFTGATEIHFVANGERTEVNVLTLVEGRNVFWRALLRGMKGYIAGGSQECYEKLKAVVESAD